MPQSRRGGSDDPLTLHFEIQRFVDHMVRSSRPAVFARAGWTPHVDVYERGDELLVVAELAGVDPARVEISVDRGLLVLRGERPGPLPDAPRTCHTLEIDAGPFERLVRLPFEVDPDAAQAHAAHGLLTISLPRRRSIPYQVPVRATESR